MIVIEPVGVLQLVGFVLSVPLMIGVGLTSTEMVAFGPVHPFDVLVCCTEYVVVPVLVVIGVGGPERAVVDENHCKVWFGNAVAERAVAVLF